MFMQRKSNEPTRRVFMLDENSPFFITESFRNLMTNISFAVPKKEERKAKTFCVSSSLQGEGKTTVAVNLALTCARTHAKTVLVDCDMRKPRVKDFFKTNKRGIVAYLSGQVNLEDIIVKDVEKNLDVVACLQTAPNPLTLINTEAFEAFLKMLENQYDYVIIDTPPVNIVADVSLIVPKTDGVVLVVRQMYSNHKTLKDAVGKFNFSGGRILGFVLNDYEVSKSKRYGGKYDYAYGYNEKK